MKLIHSIGVTAIALSAMLLAPETGAVPFADDTAVPAREIPTISRKVRKQLDKAQYTIQMKDYAKTAAILDKLMNKGNLNAYETAAIWQTRAFAAYMQGDEKTAITASEKILARRASIPEKLEGITLFLLAQLYYSQGNLDRAKDRADEFQRLTPSLDANKHIFLAQLALLTGHYADTETHILQAVAQQPQGVKESWYRMLLAAQWEQGKSDAAFESATTLLKTWSKPETCELFAGTGAQTQKMNEAEAMAAAQEIAVACKDMSSVKSPALLLAEYEQALKKPETSTASEENSAESPLPIKRVQPKLPRRVWEEKIDGMVVLEFTVRKDGTVDRKSIIVLESEPKGYFEKASIDAMRQMRYKPKVVDGVAQEMTGIRYRFEYEFSN